MWACEQRPGLGVHGRIRDLFEPHDGPPAVGCCGRLPDSSYAGLLAPIGNAVPWAIGLAWLAVACSWRRQGPSLALTLVLLALVHLVPETLVFAAFLLCAHWSTDRLNRWAALSLLAGLSWLSFAWWRGGDSAVPMSVVLGLFLVSIGIDWSLARLQKSGRIDPRHAWRPPFLAIMISLPLFWFQAVVLYQAFRERPLVRWGLERQAGEWLDEHTDPGSTILASAHVAFWAGRANAGEEAANVSDWPSFSAVLTETTPDYVVVNRQINADQLIRTDWFQERYETLTRLASPYESSSPYAVWGYRPPFTIWARVGR